MSGLQKALDDTIASLENQWTPEEIALAKRIAARYADYFARRVAGVPIMDGDWENIRAGALSIVASGTVTLANVLEEEVQKFLSGLVSEVVPGL